MSEDFRNWLAQELKSRRWSQRAFARHSGVSQPLLSQILAGEVTITPDACLKLAQALDQPPETLLRLAGILPPVPPEDDALQELAALIKKLSPAHRREALSYIRFLLQQEAS